MSQAQVLNVAFSNKLNIQTRAGTAEAIGIHHMDILGGHLSIVGNRPHSHHVPMVANRFSILDPNSSFAAFFFEITHVLQQHLYMCYEGSSLSLCMWWCIYYIFPVGTHNAIKDRAHIHM